ncbi:Mitotic-spindle organizing protein 1 [Trinorchestia longiramus]|nr:Mitotic-spindle organizing protein 1 [Trinorchestia longiramus]
MIKLVLSHLKTLPAFTLGFIFISSQKKYQERMSAREGSGTSGGGGGTSIVSARETFETLMEMSRLLNTGLDETTLALCVRLCESGANPEALAKVITELQRAIGYRQGQPSTLTELKRIVDSTPNMSEEDVRKMTSHAKKSRAVQGSAWRAFSTFEAINTLH